MTVFKTIEELIEENNSFITSIPNNMGINLVSVKGIEYDYQEDGQIKEMKIIFIPSKEEPKFENSIENTINIISIANSMFGKKEEPKQETLEEFIQRQLSLGKYQDQESAIKNSIELTDKWQAERMCNHTYILTSEQGHRVIKCQKCDDTQPI